VTLLLVVFPFVPLFQPAAGGQCSAYCDPPAGCWHSDSYCSEPTRTVIVGPANWNISVISLSCTCRKRTGI